MEILLPTDFSEGAGAAAELAVELAQRTGGRITLFHCDELPSYAYMSNELMLLPDVLASIAQETDRELAAARRRLESLGVAVTTVHARGLPWQEIVEAARRYDLIVMGTHGRTGVRHFVLGSVAEKVVRRAPCPVLTVRSPEAAQPSV